MKDNKLTCCVVRDLLPSYMEGLTEAETSDLVKEHILNCPDCQKMEQDMRQNIQIDKSPQQELKFLKKIKRTQFFAVILTCIVTLWCIWWLYNQEFHYPNTEAGRWAAVEDYIPLSDDSQLQGVRSADDLRVGAWEVQDNHLFIFYFAENEENVHGIIHLVKGLNGKYRILEAEIEPSDYSGGVYGANLTPMGTEWNLFYFASYNCRDIYRAEVEMIGCHYGEEKETSYSAMKSFELSGENFLQIMDRNELEQELGFADKDVDSLYIKEIELFDKSGENITDQYLGESSSWGSGKTTAETSLLYVYIGIVAFVGITLIRYFLHRD